MPFDRLGMPASSSLRGQNFVRNAMALAKADGDWNLASRMVRQDWPAVAASLMKAAVLPATTTDSTWASPLVAVDNSDEFIAVLRPLTILGRLTGARQIPFFMRLPRETSSALVGWRGEGLPKAVGAMAFDNIQLAPTTSAAIVVITKELLDFSKPSAEMVVRASLLAAMTQFSDQQLVDHTVAANAGISPASLTYGATSFSSSGATLAAVDADLQKLIGALVDANIRFDSPFWIMNPKTAVAWSALRGTGGEPAYPNLTVRGGTLRGIPVITSASVPVETGATSTVALIDAAEILYADDGDARLDVFRQGTLQMASTPASGRQPQVSLWQNNWVGIRIEHAINWTLAHAGAVATLTNVAV